MSFGVYHAVSQLPSRRWHHTGPWRSEYFDWYECKLMPRSSTNRDGTAPQTIGHLLALTKLRGFDRPAERRTWDQGKTHFVIQDPFDYRTSYVPQASFLCPDALISTATEPYLESQFRFRAVVHQDPALVLRILREQAVSRRILEVHPASGEGNASPLVASIRRRQEEGNEEADPTRLRGQPVAEHQGGSRPCKTVLGDLIRTTHVVPLVYIVFQIYRAWFLDSLILHHHTLSITIALNMDKLAFIDYPKAFKFQMPVVAEVRNKSEDRHEVSV
jgi:hypothetical protein